MIDAVILAGGFGTRLQKIVSDVPKPLAPIRDTPFLDLLINQLKSFSIVDRIVLAVGYKAGQIIDYYQESDFPIFFSKEDTPLGTGGALKKALSLCKNSTILALNGDCFNDYSLDHFYEHFKEKKADISLLGRKEKDPSRYGTLLLEERTFRLVSFQEKVKNTKEGWISCGTYLFKKELLENFSYPSPSFSLEHEVFPKLLTKAFYVYPCQSTFIDIGTENSFKQAQTLLANLCPES